VARNEVSGELVALTTGSRVVELGELLTDVEEQQKDGERNGRNQGQERSA
jgi:hypothetical protein